MKVIKLTNEQYDTLLAGGTIEVNGEEKVYDAEGVESNDTIYYCDQDTTWAQVLNKLDVAIHDNAAVQKIEKNLVDNLYNIYFGGGSENE